MPMKYFQEDEKQILMSIVEQNIEKQSISNILMQMNRRGKQANQQITALSF